MQSLQFRTDDQSEMPTHYVLKCSAADCRFLRVIAAVDLFSRKRLVLLSNTKEKNEAKPICDDRHDRAACMHACSQANHISLYHTI